MRTRQTPGLLTTYYIREESIINNQRKMHVKNYIWNRVNPNQIYKSPTMHLVKNETIFHN